MSNCTHRALRWELDPTSESGWICVDCDHKPGEPPGFSPEADREHTDEKVSSVLFWLHSHDLVYVSNSDAGLWVTDAVMKRCHETGRFDQLSIIGFVVDALSKDRGLYWTEISAGVLSGNDKRERCACGALSTVKVFAGLSEPKAYCKACYWKQKDEL